MSQNTNLVIEPFSDCDSIHPSPLPPWSVSTRIEAVIAIGADILSPVKKYDIADGMSIFI